MKTKHWWGVFRDGGILIIVWDRAHIYKTRKDARREARFISGSIVRKVKIEEVK